MGVVDFFCVCGGGGRVLLVLVVLVLWGSEGSTATV